MFCHGYSFYGPVPKQCDMGDRNLSLGTYLVQTTTSWKPVQTTAKKSSKFIKKITHVDDMMIYNLVKYLIQTRLRLWDIKITNFKPKNCPDDLLEIYYFYISQTKSSLDKIFYKTVYHHIIYICDFFGEFRRPFYVVCTGFHETMICAYNNYGPFPRHGQQKRP